LTPQICYIPLVAEGGVLSLIGLKKEEYVIFSFFCLAEIAQLVEHFPEEEGVAGSNPALGTA